MTINNLLAVKFEPFASAERVHHMVNASCISISTYVFPIQLLYGCSQPAGTGFWRGGATCNGASHILWAWARNAPSFVLPEDVAFQIGHPSDPIQHLVLQIHYAKLFDGKVRDFSGNSTRFPILLRNNSLSSYRSSIAYQR